MSKISFIYFDIGGVLVMDLTSKSQKLQLVKNLGINYLQALKLDKLIDKYEQPACRGELTDQQIKELIEDELGVVLDPGLSVLELLVTNFDANKDLQSLASRLKPKYQLGLLTNMNIGMLDLIKSKNLLPPINWDVVVDSSVIGMAKPARNIYEYAERQLDIPAEQILFIDNLQENLLIPQELGWQTFHYDNQDCSKSTQDLATILGLKP